MATHSKWIGLWLIGCLSWFSAFAQQPHYVTATVVVKPPYSSDVNDYSNLAMVTVVSTQFTSVFLHVAITGNNGITLETSPSLNTGLTPLDPGIPFVFTGIDLSIYFDPANLIATGIDPQELIERGLPEGTYKICVVVFNSDYLQVSGNAPAGCSNSFTVRYANPPQLIRPACDKVLTITPVQQVIFNWSPPVGAPPFTHYTLRVVEMIDPERDPTEAMQEATTPPFFETEITGSNVFLYGPNQPLLEKGKRYAWQVVAEDMETKTPFRNNGASEVCSFWYGEKDTLSTLFPVQFPGTATFNPPKPKGKSTPGGNFTVSDQSGAFPGIGFSPANVHGTLYYEFADVGEYIIWPLPNRAIKLVVLYRVKDSKSGKWINFTSDSPWGPGLDQFTKDLPNETILATGFSGPKGEFNFNFLLADSMGLLAKNVTVHRGTSEVHYIYQGDLYRVARIIVEDPYYASPAVDILPKAFESTNVGQAIAYVRSYKITVSTLPFNPDAVEYYTTAPLSNVDVYLLRKTRPWQVPENEGMPDDGVEGLNLPGYEVVAHRVSDKEGNAVFTRMVGNLGAQDKYYWYAKSKDDDILNFESGKKAYQNLWVINPNPSYNVVYSDDYVYPDKVTYKLFMSPKFPEIYGKVMWDNKEQTPIANAPVTLIKSEPGSFKEFITIYTDEAGNYRFKPLIGFYYNANGEIVGPIYWYRVTVSGFKNRFGVYNGGAVMKLGQRLRKDIYLTPKAIVKGHVVDENGGGVSGHVKVQGGGSAPFQSMAININTNKWIPAPFKLAVPEGNVTLTFEPDNETYFTEVRTEKVHKGENDLGNVVLKKKAHRIRVHVVTGSGFTMMATPPVKGARVRIVNRTDFKETDKNGIVEIVFGGGDDFVIEVLGPESANFLPAQRTMVQVPISPEFKDVLIGLTPATQISGKVMAGNSPIEGATVKLANWSGPIPISTKTKGDGSYVLHNVPIDNGLVVQAMKSTSNYVGDEKVVDVPAKGLTDVNFNLTVFDDMDITHLLGFPIQVSSLTKTGSTVRIFGELVHIPGNNRFGLTDTSQSIPFYDISIKASPTLKNAKGIPIAEPVTVPVSLGVNSVSVTLDQSLYAVAQNHTNGIRLNKSSGGKGVLEGKVVLLTGDSFLDPNVDFSADSAWVALSAAGVPGTVPFASADQQAPSGALYISDSKGKDVQYVLYGFTCDAKRSGSQLVSGKAQLPSVLHTNIAGLPNPDLKVDLGQVNIDHNAVAPLKGTTDLSIAIEKWKLEPEDWSLTNLGLRFNKGQLVTHVASVPFTSLKVKPTSIEYGNFDLNQINLGGLVNLNLANSQVVFVKDPDHWKLSITPNPGYANAGTVPGLPGFAAIDPLTIKKAYLLSNATGAFNLAEKKYRLYNIVDFTPLDLITTNDQVKIPGTLDLRLPDVPGQSMALLYEKGASGLQLGLQGFNFMFHTKGVDLKFNVQKDDLKPSGFFTQGTLSEGSLYSINVKLNHTPSKSEIVAIPNQNFPIDQSGTRKLQDIVGEMHVTGNDWTNFVFTGDLIGANGASGNLTFTIFGEVKADGQSLSVTNVSTPFGNLSYTFDFANARLTGHLNINQSFGGGGSLVGQAESVVDGSGWYFCGGAILNMPSNPYIKEAKMASVFGDYPSSSAPFITETFANYTYNKKLPSSFNQHVNGFYIDGGAAFPIPYIPDVDINLVVLTGELSVKAGGDFRLGMNFTDNGNIYYTGSTVFVTANIGLGVSVIVGCAGSSFGTKIEVDVNGEYNSNGSWYVKGSPSIGVSGSAYIGGGCCDGDCDHIKFCPVPCVKDDWSGTKTFTIETYMGSDDNYIKVF